MKKSIFFVVLLIALFFSSKQLFAAPCAPTQVGCGIYSEVTGFPICIINNPTHCELPTGQFSRCGSPRDSLCCNGPNVTAMCNALPIPTSPPAPTSAATPTPAPFEPYSPPTNETFDAVNPLLIGGGDDIDDQEPSQYASQLSTPGGIISRALTFIFPLAGLLLFALLVWGGFEMLIGSPTKKSMESGKNRITAALAGFFLLFATYWIWQIVEVIFGVAIL